MLKIKDNVDLKELEKYGFKYDELNKGYKIQSNHFKDFGNSEMIIYVNHNLYFNQSAYYTNEHLLIEVLYDLIKADLVEKVEEQ